MRRLPTVLLLVRLLAGARLDIRQIASALATPCRDGVYVHPEGPLNIMRGHRWVNDFAIAKQRKSAAPQHPDHGGTDDAKVGGCTGARNAYEDLVRKLPADGDAMAYLSEYHMALESLFVVEYGAVVADRGPQAPFQKLLESEREKCARLFAVLLVLAGGGSIRMDDGSGDWEVVGDVEQRRVAFAAADGEEPLLELESVDAATWGVLGFFKAYCSDNADLVKSCRLRYAVSPSFLIQAYICELFGAASDVTDIFAAAAEIVGRLPAGEQQGELWGRFFTDNEQLIEAYRARYIGLESVATAYNGPEHMLSLWQYLDRELQGKDGVSNQNVLALFKLNCCLRLDPAPDKSWDTTSWFFGLSKELVIALESAILGALNRLPYYVGTYSNPSNRAAKASVAEMYGRFLALFAADASQSKAFMDCCGPDIRAGLTADNFLVVLGCFLGMPEQKLEDFQRLLVGAKVGADSAFCCGKIGRILTEKLQEATKMHVKAEFSTSTASDSALCTSLRLSFSKPKKDTKARCAYVVDIVFGDEDVEIVYVSHEIIPSYHLQERLATVLEKDFEPKDKRKKATASGGSRRKAAASEGALCALLRESIERCFTRGGLKALSESQIEAMSGAAGRRK